MYAKFRILNSLNLWRTLAPVLLILVGFLAACRPAATPTESPTPEETVEPSVTEVTAQQVTSTQTPEPTVDVLSELIDVQWVLVAYGETANPTVVEEGVTTTALFGADGSVSGSGGCNQYSGSYELNGDQISFGPIAATMMACDKGMDTESAYFAALDKAERVEFTSEGRLNIFYDSGADKLVFIKGQTPLTDTLWVLQSYGDPNNPTPVEAGTSITAVFSPDGGLSGSGGCNSYTSSYTVQDSQMQIKQPSSTLMECPVGNEQEFAYFQALPMAESYKIVGPKLEISYSGGTGRLNFTSLNLTLENTLWTLISINNQALPSGVEVTALFEPGETPQENRVGGSAGCNNYSAAYSVEGEQLTISQPAATMMICSEDVMLAEQSYLPALQVVESYRILADHLTLSGKTGVLEFAANRASLEGTQWKLVSIGPLENPQSPVPGGDYTARFVRPPETASGVIVGATGCNDYNAVYAANLNEIKINPPIRTENPDCAPGLSEQEQMYYMALNAASSYRILGDSLQIPYSQGQVLNFVAIPPQVSAPEGAGPLTALNGTQWWLKSIDTSVIMPGSEVTAEFAINADGASGTISGSSGCNTYNAEITGVFQVGPPVSTKMACANPAGVMDQETTYLAALERASSFTLAGDQLVIGTQLGALVYSNSPHPMSPISPPPYPAPPIAPTVEPYPYPAPPIATPGETPTAVISAPLDGAVGQAITFDGSASLSSVDITSYAWDFGDGMAVDGAIVEHAYAAPGSYTVTLTVVDANGQTNTASINVTIR
jgi:heat shock protein HslJ